MITYVIRRRNAWRTAGDLEAAASRAAQIGNGEMRDKVQWIRSYIVQEKDGTLGSVCIYQAASPEAIEEHARKAGIPANEITPAVRTVIVRADPGDTERAA